MDEDPRVVNGVRPLILVFATLMFHLVTPGDFYFLDDNEEIVTAVFYCTISRSYMCVIYQEHGRYTHYQHYPAQRTLQNG